MTTLKVIALFVSVIAVAWLGRDWIANRHPEEWDHHQI